jgi:hypothetical protein
MQNRGHKNNKKRIGGFISKTTSLTLPTTMSKLKEKMTLKMLSQLAAALIPHKTTLICRRFMNKFISCPTPKSKQRERKKPRIVLFKKSTIRTI